MRNVADGYIWGSAHYKSFTPRPFTPFPTTCPLPWGCIHCWPFIPRLLASVFVHPSLQCFSLYCKYILGLPFLPTTLILPAVPSPASLKPVHLYFWDRMLSPSMLFFVLVFVTTFPSSPQAPCKYCPLFAAGSVVTCTVQVS